MVNFTDEKHLLIDLKDSSFQAFERLYNMYSGKLYNFIMRLSSGNQYMAEEVVQATFIRIWEVHEKVDPASSFISFLCTTRAVQYIGSTPTAILGALEPVTAVFFGVTIFGESLTPRLIGGILMIILAVTLIIVGSNITIYLVRFRKLFPKLPLKHKTRG